MDIFTCKACGSHDLLVEHIYSQVETISLSIPCTCGRRKHAAKRTRIVTSQIEEWGTLEDDHHWDYDDQELTPIDDQDLEHVVSCQRCAEDTNDWTILSTTVELDQDDNAFFVRCAGCNREIEFGWSHPGRMGRIWPAECTDFNPWKSWPEPRYRDAWAAKGWLRPGTR